MKKHSQLQVSQEINDTNKEGPIPDKLLHDPHI